MKLKTLVLMMTLLMAVMVQSIMAQSNVALRKITDSVYAYVGVPPGTPGNVFSANAGIVIGKDAVLVVDTLTSAQEAELFMNDIQKITSKPVRYVVNTHYHLDHALGNSFFADRGARIIGHAKCRDAIIAAGEKILKDPAMFGLPPEFWKSTRVVSPDMAFERELIVDLGGVSVKLIHSGIKSHSAGSIIVQVPGQNVLFTGDILFTDFHPYMGEGDLPGWEKNIDLIRAMNVQQIIPGHGPISTNKDLEDMKAYLKIFDQKATALCAKEKDVEKLTSALLKVLPERSSGDFIIPMNLKTRYLGPSSTEQGKY